MQTRLCCHTSKQLQRKGEKMYVHKWLDLYVVSGFFEVLGQNIWKAAYAKWQLPPKCKVDYVKLVQIIFQLLPNCLPYPLLCSLYWCTLITRSNVALCILRLPLELCFLLFHQTWMQGKWVYLARRLYTWGTFSNPSSQWHCDSKISYGTRVLHVSTNAFFGLCSSLPISYLAVKAIEAEKMDACLV